MYDTNKDSNKDLLSTIIIYGLLIASILKKLYCEKNPIQTQRMGFYMHAWLQCMKTIIKYWLLDCVIFNFTWGIEMKVEVCYTKSRKY